MDPITTVAAQQQLATLFPDARLEVLTGVGHLVRYERPREAAALIIDFVGDGSLAGKSSSIADLPVSDATTASVGTAPDSSRSCRNCIR